MSQHVQQPQSDRRFQLSFSAFMKVLMTPIMAGPRRCHVVVTTDRLSVTMGAGGWAFSASVPRSSLRGARRVNGPVWGWGAHGWRGRWLVNGSARGLVRVPVDPAGRGRCLVFPVKIRELTLSLDEPDTFVATLGGHTE